MSSSAELRADRGESAAGEEFFRSAEFLRAEAVTHTLIARSGGGEARIPVIVRDIPGGGRRDAISPYGYPGAALSEGPVDPGEVDWGDTGLVSLFVRDRAGEPSLIGGTVRGQVQVHDPSQERKSRMSDRQQIRRNLRDGYAVSHLPGPAADEEARAGFRRAYEETMTRADAGDRYFFSEDYFDAVLGSDRSWLFLVIGPEGDIAAGSIAVRSDGYLHYYLSGTAEEHRRASPMKSLLAAMCDFADELTIPLNLGGGVRAGDALEEFKRGFANAQRPFHTHEIVCDRAAYEELAAAAPADSGEGDFFPAYRSGEG